MQKSPLGHPDGLGQACSAIPWLTTADHVELVSMFGAELSQSEELQHIQLGH